MLQYRANTNHRHKCHKMHHTHNRFRVANIPFKICCYFRSYCQLGCTLNVQVHRQAVYDPEDVRRTIEEQVTRAKPAREAIDYRRLDASLTSILGVK